MLVLVLKMEEGLRVKEYRVFRIWKRFGKGFYLEKREKKFREGVSFADFWILGFLVFGFEIGV